MAHPTKFKNAERVRFQDPNQLGKVPPQATEFESAVIGAVLLERSALADIASIIGEEAFYKQEHKLIWGAILELDRTGKSIDILTVTQTLRAKGQLDQVGGAYAISQLTDRVASAMNITEHAAVIQEMFVKREQIRFAGEIFGMGYDDMIDPFEINSAIAKGSTDLNSYLCGAESKTAQALANTVVERAEFASNQNGITGIQTGFKEQDELFGGLQNGWLRIIAARPAMGKTSLALAEAQFMATNDIPVAFFSLEMDDVALMRRVISLTSGVFLSRLKNGNIEPVQWDSVHAAVDKIGKSKLFIVSGVNTLNGLRAEMRRLKDKHGIKAAYIDYLQLISHDVRNGNREQVVSEISRTLKTLAQAMDLPITAMSQLSRAVETRGGSKRPQLSDLRESGAIEQDADVVQFLYRPEYYEFTESHLGLPVEGLAELITAKNRDGATGDIPLRFHKELTKFTDYFESIAKPTQFPTPNDGYKSMARSVEF